MRQDIGAGYVYATHGLGGWSAELADHSRSTSGYRSFAEVAEDLAPGAVVIDLEPIWDGESFVRDVLAAPMHGIGEPGAFTAALREAPWMLPVVVNYGLGPQAIDQARIDSGEVSAEYGPLDYAPAEYLAGYWADRGADVSVVGLPMLDSDPGAYAVAGAITADGIVPAPGMPEGWGTEWV